MDYLNLIIWQTYIIVNYTNRCAWICYIHFNEWDVICVWVGSILFRIQMEYASAGMWSIHKLRRCLGMLITCLKNVHVPWCLLSSAYYLQNKQISILQKGYEHLNRQYQTPFQRKWSCLKWREKVKEVCNLL